MRNLINFDIDGGFTLDINVNKVYVIAGVEVQVDAISMYFDEDYEGYELTVNWQLTGNEELDIEIMNAFYTDDAFEERIVQLLIANGVSADAANDVCTSESGMQEEGRASYDAGWLAVEAAAYAKTL